MSALLPLAASALVAIALASSGCGGGEGSQEAGSPAGEPQALGPGSSAQLAKCVDWREGTEAERLATIAELRELLAPQTSADGSEGFPDEKAYDFFERVCAREYAGAFSLYEIYAQAAAFAPLQDD